MSKLNPFIIVTALIWLFFIYLITALTACAKEGEKEETTTTHTITKPEKEERKHKEPEPCTVDEISGGAVITCPDGSTVVINDGENGQDGTDAPMCTFEVVQTCE